jgi:hypothetical protein
MKLVELEILKISYFGNFSSHYMILGVIWQKQIKGSCVLGGATVHRRINAGQWTTWVPVSHHGLPRPSRVPQLASSKSCAPSHSRVKRPGRLLKRAAQSPLLPSFPFSLFSPRPSFAAHRCIRRAVSGCATGSTTIASLPHTSLAAHTSQFCPNRPHGHLLSLLRRAQPPCRLTVASHPRCLSASASCTAMFVVSYSCSRSPPFSRYRLVSSECHEPRPPCRHGR